MAYIYQKILESVKNTKAEISKSVSWLFDTIKAFTSKKELTESMYVKNGRLSEFFIGRMIMFSYDPKLKAKLPYYDAYPLVFPIQLYSDGFLGINLHYLPPAYRARLLDALYDNINSEKINDKTKLNISYNILNSASRFKYFKPCVKRYLYNHVKSRYYLVSINEWNKTVLLPTQRFVGASEDKIYKDSLSKI
jgi:hypothetical protein